jgi:hypothetical protein
MWSVEDRRYIHVGFWWGSLKKEKLDSSNLKWEAKLRRMLKI